MDNADANRKTLTIVYYAGHGMMKANQSQIVLPDAKAPLYNLEARLRALSELDNSYVIGIFDCCREAYDESMFPQNLTRGATGIQEGEVEVNRSQNVFLIFGCAANQGVPAQSKIANTFFEMLENAKADNDCFLLPDAKNVFNSWTPNETEA